MLRLTALMLVLALGACVTAVPMQTVDTWSHPQGYFRLAPGPGWRVLPANNGELAAFGSTMPGAVSVCGVRAESAPMERPITQDQINVRATDFTPRQRPGRTISNRTHTTLDGVTVISFITRGEPGYEGHYRIFSLAVGSDLMAVVVSCTGEAPLSPAQVASFQAFLSTLRIAPPSAST